MDLSTQYLGFDLPHPFMPGASPYAYELDTIKQLEDAGASAIVMHSLFEEQIVREEMATMQSLEAPAESFAEALSYFPETDTFRLGPDEYIEHLAKVKQAVSVPVIGSLNGTTLGGWLKYAQLIAEAGADALELNIYQLATDAQISGEQIEKTTVEIVAAVKEKVNLPVAVKLSPFYSSLANFAGHLDSIAVDALVLFNRFYQPDIDVQALEVRRELKLSDPSELLLRLRWLAILSGNEHQYALAVSGGVHSGLDAVKAVMTGADAVQIVSAVLRKGAGELTRIRTETEQWLEDNEYESLQQMKGSMDLSRSPDASAYERANYVQILQSWDGLAD